LTRPIKDAIACTQGDFLARLAYQNTAVLSIAGQSAGTIQFKLVGRKPPAIPTSEGIWLLRADTAVEHDLESPSPEPIRDQSHPTGSPGSVTADPLGGRTTPSVTNKLPTKCYDDVGPHFSDSYSETTP
jgi:hypothetical protein